MLLLGRPTSLLSHLQAGSLACCSHVAMRASLHRACASLLRSAAPVCPCQWSMRALPVLSLWSVDDPSAMLMQPPLRLNKIKCILCTHIDCLPGGAEGCERQSVCGYVTRTRCS